MDEILTQNAHTYARRQNLRLAERLGHGIHGIVYAAEGNAEPGNVAIKAHRSREPYERERSVYLRLREAGVAELIGFNVPKLIRFDDELLIIEMSIRHAAIHPGFRRSLSGLRAWVLRRDLDGVGS